MKNFRSLLLALIFGFIFYLPSPSEDAPVGKPPDWKITLESEIYRRGMSEDGKHYFIVTDGENGGVLNMYNMADGKMLWSKELIDLDDDRYKLIRYATNDLILIGSKNQYLFLKVQDGSIAKSLTLFCESWDDISWKYVPEYEASGLTLEPYFINSFSIFYGGDGFQVVDMANQKIIYQSTLSVGRAMFKEINGKISMWPYSGMFSATPDTIYELDYQKGIFKALPPTEKKSNYRLYVKDYSYGNDKLDFMENSIEYTNLTTNKVEQTLSTNPNEPDFIGPVIWNNGLGFVTSQDNVQTLFGSRTLAPVFKTNTGEVPGVIDQFYDIGNGDVVLFTYDNDDSKMSIEKIDPKTGNVKWKNTIFKYEGSFKTGHQMGGAGEMLLKMAGSLVFSVVGSMFTKPFGYKMVPNANGLINSLHKSKSSEGYAKVLSYTDKRMTIVAGGRIYSELTQGSHDNYDGEGIFTIDLENGKIISNYPCNIISKSDFDNAYNSLETLFMKNCDAIIGTSDVFFYKNEKIERLSFGNSQIKLLDATDDNLVIFAYNQEEENSDYWTIDLKSEKPSKTMVARSKLKPVYVETVFIPIFDKTNYTAFPSRLLIDEYGISAHKLTEGNVTNDAFNSPLWKFSYEDFPIGEIDMQDFIDQMKSKMEKNRNYSFNGSVYGLIVDKEKVIAMGPKGLGYIKSDGSCKWTKEWSPDAGLVTCGVTEANDFIIYSIGDNTRIYKRNCTGEVIHQSESSYDKTFVKTTPDNSGVLIVVEGQGLEFYKLK